MIAIKEMKMPESCLVCPLLKGNSVSLSCKITGKRVPLNATNDPSVRPQWCPLVEISGVQ